MDYKRLYQELLEQHEVLTVKYNRLFQLFKKLISGKVGEQLEK